jgi:hypothetical protein
VVETELGLFEMKIELVFAHPVQASQSVFGVAPERFNAIDVSAAAHELVVAMIDSKVLVKAHVHQAIIARPTIGVNDTIGVDLAPNDGLQRGFASVGDDLGVDAITTFEQAKDGGFVASATSALTSNTPRAKVRFIGFDLSGKGRAAGAVLDKAHTDMLVNVVGAAHRQIAKFSRITGRQVHSKQAQKLAKFGLTNLGTPVVPIFPNHLKKLACIGHMFAS